MPECTREYCFTLGNGKEVFLFRLQNSRGCVASISNLGALIRSWILPMPDGTQNDIVLGFDKMEDYVDEAYLGKYPWMGTAVGRHANRIRNASFSIDGHRYELPANIPPHQLHGGNAGFDKVAWEIAGSGTEPVPWLELRYESPDGEEGFPGKLDVSIRFELDENDVLSYAYHAVCDKPTIVNLAHHSYFNLHNGTDDILDHEVRICGSSMLEQDGDLLPTGNIVKVEGTAYDLRQFTHIAKALEILPEYDKSFIADPHPGQLVAELRSARSGILLQVCSTDPIIHFYTGKWLPHLQGKQGQAYGSFSGLCLETHRYPDAGNCPSFPSTVLRPGEVYSSKTFYKPVY